MRHNGDVMRLERLPECAAMRQSFVEDDLLFDAEGAGQRDQLVFLRTLAVDINAHLNVPSAKQMRCTQQVVHALQGDHTRRNYKTQGVVAVGSEQTLLESCFRNHIFYFMHRLSNG